MEDRRDALKIIGAVGATCAFPFSADELYGQHQHVSAAAKLPDKPQFFTAGEFALVTRLCDLILPATSTPGAVAAGVPFYIDLVVSSNAQWSALYRTGLRWLADQKFLSLPEAGQVALLTPLCEAADQNRAYTTAEKFFQAVKSMTADGYYTSQVGLSQELGFHGGSVLPEFPACEEH